MTIEIFRPSALSAVNCGAVMRWDRMGRGEWEEVLILASFFIVTGRAGTDNPPGRSVRAAAGENVRFAGRVCGTVRRVLENGNACSKMWGDRPFVIACICERD